MLKEPNHIDDLFNDFLHDYAEDVPTYVWNNLKDDLQARKKLRILNKIRTIAASVALLIAFGLGYYISNLDISKKVANKQNNNFRLFFDNNVSLNGDSLDLKEDDSIEKKHKEHTIRNKYYYQTSKNKKNNYSKKEVSIFDSSYLFKKYQYIISLFSEKTEENKKMHLVESGQKSNQLLTDTLLLRKENLRSEGFPSTKTKKKKLSAWSFGTKFSPVFAVEESSGSGNSTTEIKSAVAGQQDMTPEEKPLTTFSGGININYRINKRISFESGLFYLSKKQSTDNLIASQNTEFGGNNFEVYTPYQSINLQNIGDADVMKKSSSSTLYNLDADYVSNAEYIELPLIIRYKILNQKFGLDLMSGVSTNFLVSNNSYIISGDNKLWSDNPELNSVYYGATIGLGINYQFYQNFSFNLEPTFKYAFLSENSIFRKYPYSFAVFAGFSYRFK